LITLYSGNGIKLEYYRALNLERTASLAVSSIEYLVPRVLGAAGEELGSTWTLALARLLVCRHGGNYWYRFNASAVSKGPEPSRRQDVPQPVYTESGNFIVPVDHPHKLDRDHRRAC